MTQPTRLNPFSRSPRKLVLVAPVPPPHGGVPRWCDQVVRELRAQGIRFSVIDTSPKRRDLDGRTLVERIVGQGLSMVRQALQLATHLATVSQAVAHSTTSGRLALIRDILFLLIARATRAKAVLHLHFGRVPALYQAHGWERNLLSTAVRLADVVMVLDLPTHRVLSERFRLTEIVPVPNPVDLRELPPPQTVTSKKILYLGWVIPSKGIEVLLDAWAAASNDAPSWKQQVMGPISNEYHAKLLHEFDLRGVEVRAETPHQGALDALNSAEIRVLPSFTEAFPNVVLEAMALGKPVVATEVGAIPELLNSGAGATVPVGDAPALAMALPAYIHDEGARRRSGQEGRVRVNMKYRLPLVVARYREVWTI